MCDTPGVVESPPPLPAGLADRFACEGRLGRGNFGTVLRAMDRRLGRQVAIKLLDGSRIHPEDRVRFLREARLTAEISHPGVVRVLDSGGTEDGSAFIVYELIDGPSLDAIRAGGPVPKGRCLEWGLLLAESLEMVHRSGLVHRDVKPANVVLRDGRSPVLVDFGIARRVDGDTFRTAAGMILGTPAFMPPEVLRGLPWTAAGDQFSLAATLDWLAHGRLPHGSGRLEGILSRALQASGRPALPEWGAAAPVLERALSASPGERFESMAALAGALGDLPSTATATPDPNQDPTGRATVPGPLPAPPGSTRPTAIPDPMGSYRSAAGPALGLCLLGIGVLVLPGDPAPGGPTPAAAVTPGEGSDLVPGALFEAMVGLHPNLGSVGPVRILPCGADSLDAEGFVNRVLQGWHPLRRAIAEEFERADVAAPSPRARADAVDRLGTVALHLQADVRARRKVLNATMIEGSSRDTSTLMVQLGELADLEDSFASDLAGLVRLGQPASWYLLDRDAARNFAMWLSLGATPEEARTAWDGIERELQGAAAGPRRGHLAEASLVFARVAGPRLGLDCGVYRRRLKEILGTLVGRPDPGRLREARRIGATALEWLSTAVLLEAKCPEILQPGSPPMSDLSRWLRIGAMLERGRNTPAPGASDNHPVPHLRWARSEPGLGPSARVSWNREKQDRLASLAAGHPDWKPLRDIAQGEDPDWTAATRELTAARRGFESGPSLATWGALLEVLEVVLPRWVLETALTPRMTVGDGLFLELEITARAIRSGMDQLAGLPAEELRRARLAATRLRLLADPVFGDDRSEVLAVLLSLAVAAGDPPSSLGLDRRLAAACSRQTLRSGVADILGQSWCEIVSLALSDPTTSP